MCVQRVKEEKKVVWKGELVAVRVSSVLPCSTIPPREPRPATHFDQSNLLPSK